MDISIDFGASTIDIAYWQDVAHKIGVKRKLWCIKSFERNKVFADHDLQKFFKKAEIDLLAIKKNGGKVFVTGGRNRFFPAKMQSVPLIKVPEIEAIGRGGYFLWKGSVPVGNNFLVVSMGTGTCMVKVRTGKKGYIRSEHVGGTGVGGGTFMGLCRLLLKESDPVKLQKLFLKGNKSKVDLSVKDIIGSGIGLVPEKATASNLGKLAREIEFNTADLASGIENLIGQTIGILAVFAAKSSMCSEILLTGKLTRMKRIIGIIKKLGVIYNVKIVVPEDSAYVGALGAGFFG